MKVLHIVSYFPPGRIGGVGEMVSHLHSSLLRQGHRSVVLTSGRSNADPMVWRIAESPAGFLSNLLKYTGRTRDFDVVHCHQGDAVFLALAMRLRRISTPILTTYHVGHRGMGHAMKSYRLEGRRFETGWKGWKYRNLTARCHVLTDRLMLRLATSAIYISRSSAADVLGAGRSSSARVIYYGLPDRESGTQDAPAAEMTELLYAGSCSHRKRVLALPYILRKVRRAIPDARLRLVGVELDGEPELDSLFRELGVRDAVVCEGKLPSSAHLYPYYKSSKVLVVPSAYEGLPLVILEALQCGMPCVATRVSGHPEVIQDGINGFLVDKDDPAALAQRCIEILSDPRLRQRLGAAGRSIVSEGFSVQRQLAEYSSVYGDLCGRALEGKSAASPVRAESEER